MTLVEVKFLRRLREAQPHGLRRSAIPQCCRSMVQALQACEAVSFVPAPSGRGVVLRIASENAFQKFVDASLPSGLDVSLADLADRAAAVTLLGDAKRVRRGVAQGAFVRTTKLGIELRSADGDVLPVSELTVVAGSAAVELSNSKRWSFSGRLLVVENADAFWRHHLALPDVDLALLAGGRMSNRLVSWLASSTMVDCQLVHWGDYDPIGVSEYLRLAQACPGRISPFAPDEVDELLPRYGKRRLITEQAQYLDRIRQVADDAYALRMIRLFDMYGRGLEQEIFLQTQPSTT